MEIREHSQFARFVPFRGLKFMDDTVPFASREYFLFLALLMFSRGMDFLSTWIATPNLALEGNPLAKKLGWKWGVPLNFAICLALPLWPLSAIVVATASVLFAARNFQSAWLMRSLGEEIYRRWHVERVRETSSRFTCPAWQATRCSWRASAWR